MSAPALTPERRRRAMIRLVRHVAATGEFERAAYRDALREGFTLTELAELTSKSIDELGAILADAPSPSSRD